MQSTQQARKNRPGWLVMILRLFWVAVGAGILGSLLLVGYLFWIFQDIPAFSGVEDYKPVLHGQLYSSDGTLIAELTNERSEKRTIVPYENIPRLTILSFVAAEDQFFFSHFGVDPKGILRAALANVMRQLSGRGGLEGASTITMQLSRGLLLEDIPRGMKKKMLEALASVFVIEPRCEKEEILWMYLNQVYLGHGSYGVQQAAKTYFGKNVWELNLAESAMLAGLPKAPGENTPLLHPEKARNRQLYVLGRMLEDKYITRNEYDLAKEAELVYKHQPNVFLDTAPFFSEQVRKQLVEELGTKKLYEEGLQIYTTVNLDAQKAAQDAIEYGIRRLGRRQGFKGPTATVPKEKWDEYHKNYIKLHGEPELSRNRMYYGLVTEVNDAKKRATVQVGSVAAPLTLDALYWARTPRSWLKMIQDRPKRVSQVLMPGYVIKVRPTDRKGLENEQDDWRKDEEVDPDKLIWDLEQDPVDAEWMHEEDPEAEYTAAQASFLAKDPESGYTVAMVGGTTYERSEFNRSIQGCRQPGSNFKPILYSAALESGMTVSSILLDAPIVTEDEDLRWKPGNSSGFQGEVSLRYALVNSINIPAIKTGAKIGTARVIEMARRLGITSPIPDDLSIFLGSACVSQEELLNAFATIALGGLKPRTLYVTHIIDRNGEILADENGDPYDRRTYYDVTLDVPEKLDKMYQEVHVERERLLDTTVGFIMQWLLREVVRAGTGQRALTLNRPLAGKTGTTNNSYDAWFTGFTPHLVASAWIGHDRNDRPLGRGEDGARAALPIWIDFMEHALDGLPAEEFPKTANGIQWIQVNAKTGRTATESTPVSVSAPFRWGKKPDEVDDFGIEGSEEDIFFDTEF